MLRTLLLTAVSMLAFACNSLLARAALAGAGMDAVSYTCIRLGSGAAVLALLLGWARRRGGAAGFGDWASALALFVYAAGFSLAYLRLGASTGALILFASVQATMVAWGLVRGERPGRGETAGLAVAFAAFVYLLLPGLAAPDPGGSALMAGAGVAWGAYSLLGRRARDPLAATAGNFVRTLPMCALLALLAPGPLRAGPAGVALALASGVAASGLGYAIWYRALPGLRAGQAAAVQLTVPALAALGAALLLGEWPSARLVVAGCCILFGVALAIRARTR